MAQIKRALLYSSAERYIALPANIIATAIMARLFTPAEFGLTVLAGAIWALAEPIRDFGASTYLVQRHDLDLETTRTVFTLSFLITAVMAFSIFLFAGWIAKFYELPGIATYLYVSGIGFLMGPFVTPINALLRREMAFPTLTLINVTTLILNLTSTIALGVLGFSYMSFAWANVISGATGVLLSFYARPNFSIFRFRFVDWRRVAHYGAYDSGRNLLHYMMDTLPLLIFGAILSASAIGFYQRAIRLAKLPGRIVLAGLGPVVLPAFAQRSREGHGLKDGYLKGIEYLTAVIWPALLLLIVFAHPAVLILLGSQWVEIVPLVQIIAAASLIWYPAGLTDPVLTAAGGIRDAFVLTVVTIPLSIAIQTFAALHGLLAIALSMLITTPFYLVLAVYFVRRRIPFTLMEFGRAMGKSAIVALTSVLGPLLVVAAAGFRFDISMAETAIGLVLSLLGWLGGLWATHHPLRFDIQRAFAMLVNAATGRPHPR